MNRLIHILLTVLTVVAAALPSAAAVRIARAADLAAMTVGGRVYEVTGHIELPAGRTVSVGRGATLTFADGAGFSGGALHLDNVRVVGDAACLFSGTAVSGTMSNAEVKAEWWGVAPGDVSGAVNRALAFARDRNIVTLDQGVHPVADTISINRRGQRFSCRGTLHLVKPARKAPRTVMGQQYAAVCIDISASDITVSARAITASGKLTDSKTFYGTGILFSGNTYNSTVAVDTLTGLERALDFTPQPHDMAEGGTQYLRIPFRRIVARYGIFIDVCRRPVLYGRPTNVWMNENQIGGGVIEGDYGIFVASPADYGVESVDPRDYINGNVFRDITFGRITRLPMRLWHCRLDRFERITMHGPLPSGPWIGMSDCQLLDIDITGGIPVGKVDAGDGCYRVSVGSPVTGGARTYRRMVIYSRDGNKGGPAQIFVTDN